MSDEFLDRMIDMALRKGYLTPERVQVAYRILNEEVEQGKKPRFREILLRYKFLSRSQLIEIRRALAKEGVHMRMGDFEVMSRLGRGIAGTVYRARQVSLDREVALKVLRPDLATNPDFVDRFFHEARAAANISHRNIVQVFDVGQTRHTHYLVMEYVPGATLEWLIEAEGRVDEERLLFIALQMARALVYTESQGIVHRDIKPGNILVKPTGESKLADLGLALMPGEEASANAGTPYYMSPEQIKGDALDIRSDIYSLGCTLFHAVTGKPPYEGANIAATLQMHDKTPVPDATEAGDAGTVSAALNRILHRMLAKKPWQRYAHAADLVDDLEGMTKGLSPSRIFIPKPRRKDVPVWVLLLGIGLVVCAVAAAMIIVLRKPAPPVYVPIREVIEPPKDAPPEDTSTEPTAAEKEPAARRRPNPNWRRRDDRSRRGPGRRQPRRP
jgi:eukaryotic-like serine/threonine-protein kinase